MESHYSKTEIDEESKVVESEGRMRSPDFEGKYEIARVQKMRVKHLLSQVLVQRSEEEKTLTMLLSKSSKNPTIPKFVPHSKGLFMYNDY